MPKPNPRQPVPGTTIFDDVLQKRLFEDRYRVFYDGEQARKGTR